MHATVNVRQTADTLQLAARELRYAADQLDRIAGCLLQGEGREAGRCGDQFSAALGDALERIEGLVPADVAVEPAA